MLQSGAGRDRSKDFEIRQQGRGWGNTIHPAGKMVDGVASSAPSGSNPSQSKHCVPHHV